MKPLVAPVVALALVHVVGLTGCVGPSPKPQPGSSTSAVVEKPAAVAAKPTVVQHHLSRVADAKAVTPEMLASIKEGKTTTVDLIELLGDIKPFTLGDGKRIYRYDIGKFIFDAKGVLLRKHINP